MLPCQLRLENFQFSLLVTLPPPRCTERFCDSRSHGGVRVCSQRSNRIWVPWIVLDLIRGKARWWGISAFKNTLWGSWHEKWENISICRYKPCHPALTEIIRIPNCIICYLVSDTSVSQGALWTTCYLICNNFLIRLFWEKKSRSSVNRNFSFSTRNSFSKRIFK